MNINQLDPPGNAVFLVTISVLEGMSPMKKKLALELRRTFDIISKRAIRDI